MERERQGTGIEHDDRDEIDLLELLFAFRKRILWILLAVVLGGILSFGGTRLLFTPMYESTTTMLVLTSETTLSSLAELQLGTQLTNDYEILTTSRAVLETVMEDLALDIEYEKFREALEIDNPEDSRIMEITLEYPDPEEAKVIVDKIAEVTSEFIGDQMEGIPPKVIDEGQVAEKPSSPKLLKNTLIGMLAGLVLSCGIISVLTVMDDTIKTEDDIEYYLGIPTLASVPDRKDYISGKKNSRSRKQNAKKARKPKARPERRRPDGE